MTAHIPADPTASPGEIRIDGQHQNPADGPNPNLAREFDRVSIIEGS